MKTFLALFVCLFFLVACGLNASQEKSLNTAVSKYLFAVNSDLKLSRASYTHPSVLKYLKKKGHDEFKNYFKKENLIWTDAIIGKLVSKDELIHIELKIALKKDEYSTPKKNRLTIYALSDDKGLSWFFVQEEEYMIKKCGNFQRLIQ